MINIFQTLSHFPAKQEEPWARKQYLRKSLHNCIKIAPVSIHHHLQREADANFDDGVLSWLNLYSPGPRGRRGSGGLSEMRQRWFSGGASASGTTTEKPFECTAQKNIKELFHTLWFLFLHATEDGEAKQEQRSMHKDRHTYKSGQFFLLLLCYFLL